MSPDIGSQRLLSNGASLALLDPSGEVSWWCAPDADSPPLLWRLLASDGAAATWVGCAPSSTPGDVAGPALRTVVTAGAQRIELWDALLVDDDGHPLLVRLARGLDRAMTVEHRLALGGFDGPRVQWDDQGTATLNDMTLHVRGGSAAIEGTTLTTSLTAPWGRWTALTVGGDAAAHDISALLARVRRAVAGHERGFAGTFPPRHHPQRARDALAVLSACTYRSSGAVLAAATTSLPEAVGGSRQFDYRYSWLRDAGAAVAVAALFGKLDQARQYLRFVERTSDSVAGSASPPIVTDVHGRSVPDEREVVGVAGWRGSRPVRVGNGAAGQVQHDAVGMFIEAVSVFIQQGGRLGASTWRLTQQLADLLCEEPGPTNGIWEFRTPRQLVSADIGRWLGIDRAIWISRGWRPLAGRRRWLTARDAIRERVLGAITADGGLPQAYGEHPSVPDASALLIPLFGLLPARDPRSSRLVDATLAQLDAWPFVYRYPPTEDDRFLGLEGTFTVASWWAVGALAAVGRYDQARARARELDNRLPRLLAEEVDPVTGGSLGNTPLVWAHIEAARSLYLLDAADLRRRFTVVGLSAWRAARFVSLRTRVQLRRSQR